MTAARSRVKRVAIMQPYFLPYIGYWQLVAAVDEFVVYDTVQFSSGSWINRNRIRLDDRIQWLTVPLERAPHRTAIRHRRITSDDRWRRDMVRRVGAAHPAAPFRSQGIALLQKALQWRDRDLTGFLVHSITLVARQLGIDTTFRLASALPPPSGTSAEERVIAICRELDASDYFNLSGGVDLYDGDRFRESGITLHFRVPPTPERDGTTARDDRTLSILDLLMRRSSEEIASEANSSRWTQPDSIAGGRGNRTTHETKGGDHR